MMMKENADSHIHEGEMKHGRCYMPEQKQQSSVCVIEGDRKPTKLRQARSVIKNMIAFFPPRWVLSGRSHLKLEGKLGKQMVVLRGTPPFVYPVS
ncbi:hypothetical protein EVAR_27197_1 [Eumeta japonica]|uniref:Uncharacterized protein n=1 Tax=Eumeta variegata TaxID=151549 RepID=A0A4C1VY39_EUMVA|nr:hypothetical protein EVAR_27197_1 [Eumeta japonica]